MAVLASDSIDQRFVQLIQQFGLTKNSFAISLGKTASVVQHLVDGRNKPGYDLLCRVFEIYPNVSRDWLLLGRGPMLVGGSQAPKPPMPAPPTVAELPLEPIDLSDIEASSQRRPGPGAARTRLQPSEIAATLALAAAAQQPVRSSVTAVNGASLKPHSGKPEVGPALVEPIEAPAPAIAQAAISSTVEEGPVVPVAPPVSTVDTPVAAPVAPVVAALLTTGNGSEMYVTAALHAQHLQHQLALAEMRNQHLLEQQQMLREMLAMARQAMV